MDIRLESLIESLQLKQHPEGGFYRETFRSSRQIDTPAGSRNSSTAIYYLLPSSDYSGWHRVSSDEVWHHYQGQSLTLHLLDETGYRAVRLGPHEGQEYQFIVPAGCWQAAEVIGDGYALCGCTVAPGFDFDDFEMGTRGGMLSQYPSQQVVIEQWIKP
jgi:predicted cupin superfamily sugar epimerase